LGKAVTLVLFGLGVLGIPGKSRRSQPKRLIPQAKTRFRVQRLRLLLFLLPFFPFLQPSFPRDQRPSPPHYFFYIFAVFQPHPSFPFHFFFQFLPPSVSRIRSPHRGIFGKSLLSCFWFPTEVSFARLAKWVSSFFPRPPFSPLLRSCPPNLRPFLRKVFLTCFFPCIRGKPLVLARGSRFPSYHFFWPPFFSLPLAARLTCEFFNKVLLLPSRESMSNNF